MRPQDFDETLGFIQDDTTKTKTNMRDLIPANIKLAVFFLRVYTNISTAKAASIYSGFSTWVEYVFSSQETQFGFDFHHLKTDKVEHVLLYHFLNDIFFCHFS